MERLFNIGAYAFFGMIGWGVLMGISAYIQYYQTKRKAAKLEVDQIARLRKCLEDGIVDCERTRKVYETLIEQAGSEAPERLQ